MMCYKDMTFCEAKDCANRIGCNRDFNEYHQAKAREWWGKDGAPVAFADFSNTCSAYKPVKGKG